MFNFTKKDIAGFKTIGLLSAVILFIILTTFGIKSYFTGKIISNWTVISEEKNSQIHTDCLDLFYSYQKKTSDFASSVARNRKLLNGFLNQNTRKTYEALYDLENINNYNVELYNTRLELFIFSGRQVNPDILELKQGLDSGKFSTVKEIGLYSYLVVIEQLKEDDGTVKGVAVISSLLDIEQSVQNKFFSGAGIKKEIYDKYHIDVLFDFSRSKTPSLAYDTTSGELTVVSINNINKQKIGKLVIPNLDQSSYLLNVSSQFDNVIGILVFAINMLALFAVIILSLKTGNVAIRILLMSTILIISRYVWLALDFPSKLITEMGSDIFSPIHFASGYAFGAATSIGELIISSIMLLVITIYTTVNIVNYYRAGNLAKKNEKIEEEDEEGSGIWKKISITAAALLVSFYSIHIYGLIIQSLIYNSTIRFIDKSDIFSFSQPELIIVRLTITFLSVSLLLILASSGMIIIKKLDPFLKKYKGAAKSSALIVFAVIILLNLLISALPESFIDISLKFNLRAVILSLAGLFTFFIQRQTAVQRDYRFVNVANVSLLLLACVIFVPAVLLNKITTQENRYLEKAAKEISMQSNDKISFLISSTLDDVTESPEIETDLLDKNKNGKLAFSIWASSKFYDEDLNSAVFVLDTAKRLISDFNINPNELHSDSVVSFTLRSLNTRNADTVIAETDEETALEDEEQTDFKDINTVNKMFELLQTGEVLQNKEMRFYTSIRPIERTSLRNDKFSNNAGYVIVASGYDAKNFLTQTNMGLFKNFTRDNILSKLTSIPVISEFSEGELVGSSNKDVSKSFIKSIDAFRESVKDKVDKSTLRYDEFENEIYKSFYVLTNNSIPGSNIEKVYVVSVKVNDFGLSTFFFFRYLLFVVLIYGVILGIYLLYKLSLYIADSEKNRFFKFGFREKLFASFLLASVIPIVILAIYTREFVKDKNEEFYRNQLISDLRIVEQYIKSRESAEMLKQNKNQRSANAFNYGGLFDKSFSESDKNFNFYVKAKLAATTNEQLYKSDLLDTRISGNAYYNIALLRRDYFPESQQIGDFTFIVGYKPIYDNFNNVTGIISTQTVFKQSEINQELTESLVYILGPYFTAVIVLIFIVNFLSYRISNPVLRLQKATEQLSKGNIDVQVKSNSKDEIGELVNSFNRMIRELKRSRAELKKAEREGAWRDIARQVAHEIKNPLTPMKLAMQHLYAAYKVGSPDFPQVVQKTNKLIIDQIETLNKIATEFSNFAKLPSRNYETLDINEILTDVVGLMNTDGKIHLKSENENVNKSAGTLHHRSVIGDRDEVRRAFINIIKNSIQAVDENEARKEKGLVDIETMRVNGYYSVKIKDNGIGMDEETQQKLFEPYFSTKSSGMGLGLVITKKILDDMRAKISVKSKQGSGTEVEVKFRIEENA